MSSLALLLAAYLFWKKQLPPCILAYVVIVIIRSALMRLIATFALYSDYYSPVNLFEAISLITAIFFGGFLSSPFLFNLKLTRFHLINLTLDIQSSARFQITNSEIIKLLQA